VSQQISPPADNAPLRVIAITGCDGSGKSTLAASLVSHLSSQGQSSTELFYLGQSSGRIGEWISSLPVIGASFGRYLLAKSERVHDNPSTPPGNVTALVIFLLSYWRAYKFRRMLAKSQQGHLLITDRYPQAEVAGFRFDGPQLAKTVGGNGWVRALRKHEQKLYRWMASYQPLLLIRLDIDEQTAHSRKPDHKISVLREKITVIPHLTFNGAKILDLDGREPASEILDESLRAIRASLS
jgi:thymidylate kinase